MNLDGIGGWLGLLQRGVALDSGWLILLNYYNCFRIPILAYKCQYLCKWTCLAIPCWIPASYPHSGMTCWVQWVVLSLALFSPTPELNSFPVEDVSKRLVSSLPSRIACGVESPAAEVKLPGLARFYLFRCICNLFYFCKTWICMSTIVVCVPWLVLDRGLIHIQLRNSGSWISGRDKMVSEPTLTVGQAKWKP